MKRTSGRSAHRETERQAKVEMMSLKLNIELKCKDCNFDHLNPGTALEQIAVCSVISCPLHPVRPLPRGCRRNGVIDPVKIARIDEKLRDMDRERAKNGR